MSVEAPSRRQALAGGGLVVAFCLAGPAFAQGGGEGGGQKPVAPGLPGSLKTTPWLDAWIRVDADGRITVFTGKAELGQGIKTALIQIAAEELDVPPQGLRLVTADTGRTPNEGVTAGSHSMQDSGTAILNAAANVRMLLAQAAAARLGSGPDAFDTTGDGAFRSHDGRTVRYGELAAGLSLHVAAQPNAPLRSRAAPRRTMGRDFPRVDIPAKLTGGEAYVQDLRLPGMLHARVVRGPSFGTELTAPDFAAVQATPGVVAVARNGRFAAVIAEREWTAVQALQRLQQAPWRRTAPPLPEGRPQAGLGGASQDQVIFDKPGGAGGVRTVKARYSRPWLMHAAVGPSCAVALFQAGQMTVWTHTQGVYPLRGALAQLLRMAPEKVRCIHVEGSGCYGHNGADDVAADAALAALAVPGRPVRMQWMREQEMGWEPLGCAQVGEAQASLDASGRIAEFRYEVWSHSHNGRPTTAGGLVAGAEVEPAFPPQTPRPIPMPEGGGDRNAIPIYAVPAGRVVSHFVRDAPLRASALRSLGAHLNSFAIECFMDELARVAKADPVAFRLAHLEDPRARDVVSRCAEAFGWAGRRPSDGRRGSGFAFARYKNLASYCAVALEVEVEHETGAVQVGRVVAAVDAGDVVNPNGLQNQIEGGIVQALSWSTVEEVGFDQAHRTSFDWSAYPIARFKDVPRSVTVQVVDRPGAPFLGAGEASQGPASAALANAVADACGARIRDLPISPDKVKAAIGV
ncbi:MAG TPA: molybdopterin cofactor-binding domain-containing protein [Phenylobacterium sp.]|uniref:xanthine dehydrogenase family protein molybdopterin-binding subunit n=1 Tax=Phenylobacterium sp. TaxID=1871053 RepID=UPI002CAABFD9|nr:molybdopterin cofactor-binding domain-containing protein [Phenylobacterium sp.]HSV03804.1 molybdopterin cofactor-binding domain-containing protein [Phenylobacterium sp.]